MNMSMFKLFKIILLTMPLLIASCGLVTETGNPCQGGDCTGEAFAEPEDAGEAAAATYTNHDFGVQINYPASWNFQESADGSSVTFRSETRDAEPDSIDYIAAWSTVKISFEILDPIPESLFAYLFDEYPERTFSAASTSNLSGYVYDNPNPGLRGGDQREYFFLDDNLLIHIEAEILSSDENAFTQLLEGIIVM